MDEQQIFRNNSQIVFNKAIAILSADTWHEYQQHCQIS